MSIEKLIEEQKKRTANDAKRFAELDSQVCQMCYARGEDKRSLIIDCFYAVHEVVPEAIDLAAVTPPMQQHTHGYYLRICKNCRGGLLGKLREWAEACRAMRGQPKDSDGSPKTNDPERNIPIRENGTVVKLTRDEWDDRQRKRNKSHGTIPFPK